MNKNDLIKAFGYIDDQLIEEAENYKSNNRRLVALVAASLLLLVTLLIGTFLINKSNNPTETVHLTESSVNIYDYQIKRQDYIIKNSRLISYIGNESVVPIPNDVKTITSAAFGNNDHIKTIVLGENVEDIESEAFYGLSKIENFLVDDNNKHYRAIDTFLVKNDGTLVLSNLGEYGEDRTADDILYYVERLITQNTDNLKLYKKIEIGNSVLCINCEIDETNNAVKIYATELEAFGEKLNFDSKKYIINGNQKFQCFECDNYFVMKSDDLLGHQTDVYIFYNGGYFLFSGYEGEYDFWGNRTDSYNVSEITFYEEDNILYYHRIPQKSYKNVDQVRGIILEKCVSRNEFYKEFGTVEVIDGNITFSPIKSYTLDELIDLENEYSLWKETAKGHIPEGLTLDEYLEWNSGNYETAK